VRSTLVVASSASLLLTLASIAACGAELTATTDGADAGITDASIKDAKVDRAVPVEAAAYVPVGKVCVRSANPTVPGLFVPSAADAGAPDASDAGAPDADAPDAGADDAGTPDAEAPDAAHVWEHLRAPQVANSGGPTLHLPVFVSVSFPKNDKIDEEEDFLNSVGCTDYWAATTADYGVGEGVGGKHVRLTETPPPQISDNEIQTWLRSKISTEPGFTQPETNTVYVLFYPPQTTISLDGQLSCQTFGGYHNSFNYLGHDYAYAVIPECGAYGSWSGLDAITGPLSHELIEAVTDPVPMSRPAYQMPEPDGLGFAVLGGGEVTDMCEFGSGAFYQPTDYPFQVARSWSNSRAWAFEDPCVPAPSGPFFAAGPRFASKVSIDLGLATGAVDAAGIKLAVGQSTTVDIVAFASGSVPAWNLTVRDSQAMGYGTPELQVSLDTHTVQHGDVAHLTVTRIRSAANGASSFVLTSRSGARESLWWGLVTE
jgi:hypothetical protein